ncbi:hypothetical protein ROHU_037022 [Labeo rohita]|uniref:Uncharacterized protein n=1 Tax=Labeo rohita TaxID=84645 RepID=A0A498MJ91_LABRO|nr:hypothetical protein ROHU_037022 [Labeo rohita]
MHLFQCFPQQCAGNSYGIYMLMYLYILSINIHRGRCAIDSPVVVHSVDGEVLPRRVLYIYIYTRNCRKVFCYTPDRKLTQFRTCAVQIVFPVRIG